MPEVEIIRKQIIVIDEVETNSYGDLTWADKEGKSYKVKSTRKQYFGVIIPGQTVEISFAKYKGTEYPYSAMAVEDKTPIKPPSTKPTETPIVVKPEISPQERGMWWKEVGENFRVGLFKKDDGGAGTQLWAAYITRMLTSLEIKLVPVKKVQAKESPLVEEAKKLGAEEIGKLDYMDTPTYRD